MQDPTLLEFAWLELLEQNKAVTTEELAEVMYCLGIIDHLIVVPSLTIVPSTDDIWESRTS